MRTKSKVINRPEPPINEFYFFSGKFDTRFDDLEVGDIFYEYKDMLNPDRDSFIKVKYEYFDDESKAASRDIAVNLRTSQVANYISCWNTRVVKMDAKKGDLRLGDLILR
jgi:hypothetical protein